MTTLAVLENTVSRNTVSRNTVSKNAVSQDHDTHRQTFASRWAEAQPTVAAFLWSLVPHRHDADDLLQRTAKAALDAYERFDPSQPFHAWAIGFAKIEVRRFRQERSRDRLVFDDEAVDAVATAYESCELEMAEVRQSLQECIQGLRGRLKEVVLLTYGEEAQPAEVARKLQVTENAVSVSLHRARAALRECVERRLKGSESGNE